MARLPPGEGWHPRCGSNAIGVPSWGMWDRVFGRPKETVEHQTEEPEAVRALRALTPEQRLQLWRRRGVHLADEEPKTESA
jgi:hypothetical protein